MSYEAPQFDESPEGSEPLLPPEEERPRLDMKVGTESYTLTWENTVLRTFAVGNGEFDYVFHELDDNRGVYLFFSQLEVGPPIKEFLEENCYPIRHDPMLDAITINLYSNALSSQIEDSRKEAFPD
jgi:hypothetical protein